MFAWAGILFFTNAANPKGIEHAKKIFSSVFIGFLIALSGWLVVQVILQAVTNTSFYTPTSWSSLSCPDANRPRNLSITNVLQGSTVVAAPAGPTTPGAPDPTNPGGNVLVNCTSSTCSDADARSSIDAYNAQNTTNKVTSASGVSYQGVDPSLLQAVLGDVSGANAGTVTVTSGNDSTHVAGSEHNSGNAVDIGANNQAFDNFIGTLTPVQQNFVAPGSPAYQDASGYIWSFEPSTTAGSTGNHWHVSKDGH